MMSRSQRGGERMSSSVKWLSNQTYELFEQYSEGNFDRITLNRLVLEATEKAKEMEIAGKEISYADGYKEGYKRALEMIQWYIKNHISGMPQDHIGDTNKKV
jgi:flagellar biosynthesis/type III secretory pathway protein FliH